MNSSPSMFVRYICDLCDLSQFQHTNELSSIFDTNLSVLSAFLPATMGLYYHHHHHPQHILAHEVPDRQHENPARRSLRKRMKRDRTIIMASPSRQVLRNIIIVLLSLLLLPQSIYAAETTVKSPQSSSYTDGELLEALDTILSDVIPPSASYTADAQGGLFFRNLSVRTTNNNNTALLHPCSGFIPNGHLAVILGPSGSGKTSLLQALGGRSPHYVDGTVAYSMMARNVNEEYEDDDNDTDEPDVCATTPDSSHVAWVSQTDAFFTTLTPRESLQLAAFFELPHWTDAERQQLVEHQLESIGLHAVQNHRIGSMDESLIPTFGNTNQRLSGGERRRLTVALEFLTHDRVWFLAADEPSSGLDAALSGTIVQLFQSEARQRQIPVLCSLHQPRSSIWHAAIDHVILLAPGGRMCFCGPKDECLPYFEQIGYPCPALTNPAEFLVDLVSLRDPRDPQYEQDLQRIEFLANAFAEYQKRTWKDPAFVKSLERWSSRTTKGKSNHNLHDGDCSMRDRRSPKSTIRMRPGPLRRITTALSLSIRRFGALLRRSWRQNMRSGALHVFRFCASTINALLLSLIFPTVVRGVPPLASSVADRVALLSFGAINMAFLAFLKAVTIFAEERPVIHREQTRRLWTPLEYLLAKALAEFPTDMFFATVFTTVLKWYSGIRISWERVTATFSLLTVSTASLGYFIASCTPPSGNLATTASIPVLVVLMVVGIINPSGIDPSRPPPALVQYLKLWSPFRYAIEALSLGEYTGMKFRHERGRFFGRLRDLPKMGAMAMVKNGDQVIQALGLQEQTYRGAMTSLALLSVQYLGLSWVALTLQDVLSRSRKRRGSNGDIAKEEEQQERINFEASSSKQQQIETISSSGPAHLQVPLIRR